MRWVHLLIITLDWIAFISWELHNFSWMMNLSFMDEFWCLDSVYLILGILYCQIVDGWIYSITCKYMLLMLFLFYFVIYIVLVFSLFLGLIVACIYCLNCGILFLYGISQCMGHVMWMKSPRGNSINKFILISHHLLHIEV